MTNHPADAEPPADPTLSVAIDRTTIQLEAATDPAVRRAWQAVLDELTAMIPIGADEEAA